MLLIGHWQVVRSKDGCFYSKTLAALTAYTCLLLTNPDPLQSIPQHRLFAVLTAS